MFYQRLLRDYVSKIHPGTICFIKDPLRDHVSSEIYSGTMFHQRSTQGLCFIRDPLRDYVSSKIHSGTLFHQRSTQGLCFIKDPLWDYVSSEIYSGTMFHQGSTQGLRFIEDPLRDYVSSNIHSGTMFHQSVLNGQDHRWSLIIGVVAHSWCYCVHAIGVHSINKKWRHAWQWQERSTWSHSIDSMIGKIDLIRKLKEEEEKYWFYDREDWPDQKVKRRRIKVLILW